MPIKVLVADHSVVTRRAIVALLQENHDMEIAGVAETISQTLELAAKNKPDVLILDVFISDEKKIAPSNFHLDLLRLELLKHVRCIVATSIKLDHEAKKRSSTLGAKTVLDKSNLDDELISSIQLHYLPPLKLRAIP